ncbi:MAG: hypothetical protein ABIQ44_12345 [Chloroflexia bacterium]
MDFDAEDERRKRKNLEKHREYSQVHDTTKDPASEEGERERMRHPMADLQRLKGRGNGSVRIAMMEGLQQTHGNRAVQRFFGIGGSATGNALGGKQDEQASGMGNPLDGIFGPKKGSGGGIAGDIIGGIAEALGSLSPRDPMVEQMWRSAVIDPIQSSVEQLKTVHGSETEKIATLKEIRENLRNAHLVVREIKDMIEEGGVNPEMVARLKASINGLIAVEAGISTHIPEKEDASAARSMLEIYVDEAKALGDALIEGAPMYNPVTYKPVGPPGPAADNPMATRLWSTTVVQPLEKAIKRLKGHPTSDQLNEALEEVGRAKVTIDKNIMMYMGNPTLGARVDKVGQYLLVVMRVIQDKLGKEVSLEDLSGELALRGIPMEYYVDAISIASGQIAANARKKKDADAGSDATGTK